MASIQDKKKDCEEIGLIFMQFFSTNPYLKISVLIALVFVPTMAYAQEDERGFSAIDNLGWLAVGCGMAANLSLVIFKKVRKIPVMKLVGGSGTLQSLTPMYRPVLNFHILLNSVGFFAGLTHGFILLRGLDYISLSLVIVMTVSMISGIILRFTSGKNSKFFSRLVHGQVILAALLFTLVVLHIITRWHHGILMNYI